MKFKIARIHIEDNDFQQCSDSECLRSHRFGLYERISLRGLWLDNWMSDHPSKGKARDAAEYLMGLNHAEWGIIEYVDGTEAFR